MKPLNSFEIFYNLKKDKFSKNIFKNVLPRDRLPSHVSFPSAFVINTHDSNRPGEHWLAIYFDSNGFCTFFDSYGNHPRVFGLVEFIENHSLDWTYNDQQIQSYGSTTCGFYCIYFILLLSRKLDLNDVIFLFDKDELNLNDFNISRLI